MPLAPAESNARFEHRQTLNAFASFLSWLSFRSEPYYRPFDWRQAVEAHKRASRPIAAGAEEHRQIKRALAKS